MVLKINANGEIFQKLQHFFGGGVKYTSPLPRGLRAREVHSYRGSVMGSAHWAPFFQRTYRYKSFLKNVRLLVTHFFAISMITILIL